MHWLDSCSVFCEHSAAGLTRTGCTRQRVSGPPRSEQSAPRAIKIDNVDTTAPTVAISSTAPNPTNTSPIPFTVLFSEPVIGFTITGITVSNGTVGNFSGSGASYSFDVTP